VTAQAPGTKKRGPPPGFRKGVKVGGRVKGTPNKFTASARQAFELAFSDLQKNKNTTLTTWAKLNLSDFYKLYARLIPNEIVGPGGGALQIAGVVSVYMPDNGRRNDSPALVQPPHKPLRIQPRARLQAVP
jgi:hypothetical protein